MMKDLLWPIAISKEIASLLLFSCLMKLEKSAKVPLLLTFKTLYCPVLPSCPAMERLMEI